MVTCAQSVQVIVEGGDLCAGRAGYRLNRGSEKYAA